MIQFLTSIYLNPRSRANPNLNYNWQALREVTKGYADIAQNQRATISFFHNLLFFCSSLKCGCNYHRLGVKEEDRTGWQERVGSKSKRSTPLPSPSWSPCTSGIPQGGLPWYSEGSHGEILSVQTKQKACGSDNPGLIHIPLILQAPGWGRNATQALGRQAWHTPQAHLGAPKVISLHLPQCC